jgi:hypothetical protein
MRAWDLMMYTKDKYAAYNAKENNESVYTHSHILDPALEISIVFGRQLLDFLRINYNSTDDRLEDFIALKKKGVRSDDIFITLFHPTMTSFPIDNTLTISNAEHIKCLIKVANKAAAHLTTTETTSAEFESMKIARQVIYDLILHYVPGLRNNIIWWEKRDEQRNAIMT